MRRWTAVAEQGLLRAEVRLWRGPNLLWAVVWSSSRSPERERRFPTEAEALAWAAELRGRLPAEWRDVSDA